MTIKGTIISSGKQTRMRADAAAIRKMRFEQMQSIDAERQAMYRLAALKNAAQSAEVSLAQVIALHERRAADVAGMREEAAETGRLNPGLAVAVATLAEFPAMIAGARARAEAARAVYEAENARQAAEKAAVVEPEADPEAEPVDGGSRGRGRPRKVA